MKKMFLVILAVCMFAGCDYYSFTGKIKVDTPLSVKTKDGINIDVATGEYEAKFDDKPLYGGIKLNIKKATLDKKDIKMILDVPFNTNAYQVVEFMIGYKQWIAGEYKLSSGESGQPFDLSIQVKKEIVGSKTSQINNKCVLSSYEDYVCWCDRIASSGVRAMSIKQGRCEKICDHNGNCRTVCENSDDDSSEESSSGGSCEPTCGDVTRYTYGRQMVERIESINQFDVALIFKSINSADTLATLQHRFTRTTSEDKPLEECHKK